MKRRIKLDLLLPDGVTVEQISAALSTGLENTLFWNEQIKKYLKVKSEAVLDMDNLTLDFNPIEVIEPEVVHANIPNAEEKV